MLTAYIYIYICLYPRIYYSIYPFHPRVCERLSSVTQKNLLNFLPRKIHFFQMRNHPAEEAKTPSVFRPFEFQTKIQDIPIHLLLVPWPTRMEIAQRWKVLYLGPFFTPMKAAGVSGVLPAFEMTNSFNKKCPRNSKVIKIEYGTLIHPGTCGDFCRPSVD